MRVDLFPQFEPQDGDTKIQISQGAQTDAELLDKVAKEHAPKGLDIIVDDGSPKLANLPRSAFGISSRTI